MCSLDLTTALTKWTTLRCLLSSWNVISQVNCWTFYTVVPNVIYMRQMGRPLFLFLQATIAGLRQIDDLLACYWQQTRMLHCPLLAIRHLSAMNDPSLLASTALDRNCFCALSAASGNRVFTPLSSTPRGHLSTHFERTVSSSTTLYNRHIDQQV